MLCVELLGVVARNAGICGIAEGVPKVLTKGGCSTVGCIDSTPTLFPFLRFRLGEGLKNVPSFQRESFNKRMLLHCHAVALPQLTLHAHHLLERVHHLDQVASAPPSPRRCPCRPSGVSSITSLSLRHSTPSVALGLVGEREALLGLGAAHHAAGAVAAALEALRVALAAHDVAARAHAARDDAELARPSRSPRPCGSRTRLRRSDVSFCT